MVAPFGGALCGGSGVRAGCAGVPLCVGQAVGLCCGATDRSGGVHARVHPVAQQARPGQARGRREVRGPCEGASASASATAVGSVAQPWRWLRLITALRMLTVVPRLEPLADKICTAIHPPRITAARVISWVMSAVSAAMNVGSRTSPLQTAPNPMPPISGSLQTCWIGGGPGSWSDGGRRCRWVGSGRSGGGAHAACRRWGRTMPSSLSRRAPADMRALISRETVPVLIPVRSVMSRRVRAPSWTACRTRSRLVADEGAGPAVAVLGSLTRRRGLARHPVK